MKRLSLIELEKQLNEEEVIPLKNIKEISGGARAGGCCHGYCQECETDTYETSDNDNREMDTY